MSPRPYRRERRRAAAEETRSRIIRSAIALLTAEGGTTEFSIDALAKSAGVARMTVYYQFGSKRGLLETIFDTLAAGGLAAELPTAYAESDPVESLNRLIRAFTRFWASERTAIRRLRAQADLDPVVGERLNSRDERRRDGLRTIVGRISTAAGRPNRAAEEIVDILHTLTSFETFDSLSGDKRSEEEVERIVRDLALGALGAGGHRLS